MVKCNSRTLRAKSREILKLKLELSRNKHDVTKMRNNMLSSQKTKDKELLLEKQTSEILRKSLQNFSGPFYELKLRYKKLYNKMKALSSENGHLKRGILQLNDLRKKKRRDGKTRLKLDI